MRIAQTLIQIQKAFLFFLLCFLCQPELAAQCPTIQAIMVDACGTEQDNEFIIINSGGGFNVSDLQIDYDINNNIIGPENNDVNIGASPCGVQAGAPGMISGCSNVIPAGPGTMIPPNSYVVFQTSAAVSTSYDFSGVCGTQQCVYVIRSTCARSAGAFSNSGYGTRVTGLSINGGCNATYTYDRALLTGGNGAYFIPPGTYGNNGCSAPPVSFGNPPVAPPISGIPANICQTAAPIALPTTQSGVTGTWSGQGVSNNTFNPAGLIGNITLTFTPAAGQCAMNATTVINVQPPVTPVISGVPANICQNDPPIALPTSQSGVNGNWSGQGVAGNNFNPTGLSGNITLTFTPNAGQCANPATTTINVTTPSTPAITGVPASICENEPAINLPTTQGGFSGNWSGPGVNNNLFNPMGLSGNIALTFTPNAGQCASPATTTINVTTPTTPAITGVPASICENAPAINLPTTQGGFSGNWSGQGVSNNSFNPTGLSGNVTLTFTPNAGQCASPASTTINVTTPVSPAITGVPASICETAPAINLPTTQGGFSGNWSGQGVSNNSFNPTGLGGNITLTFTPNAGQCASPASTTINVNTPVSPAITGVPASICENAPAINLPTTQGGFNGNWSGQGLSNNSFNPTGLNGNITLTFTPNAGQCANPATTTINVTTPVSPAITGVPASICENEPAINLPSTQGGFSGNWSGQGVSNNSFNPTGLSGNVTLTFTPNAGQCAYPATTTINVTTPSTPAITGVPASICENAPAINLPTTQGGFSGNWSGQGVNNNIFNPTGLSGNITLTFTPNAGQCASPATATINVTTPVTPAITGVPASICENENAINLPTTQGGFSGNWSGQGVSNNSFNPMGLNGNITLTFAPNAGQCANPATTSINVTIPVSPAITGVPASICENAPAINLPTTQGGFSGIWSGQGVNNNSFNPSGLNGNITLIFTPNAGQCASPATTSINVTAPVAPLLGTAMLCQNNGPYPLVNLIDPNFPSGTWSGPGVNGGNFNPAGQNGNITLTFTPSANCTLSGTTTVTVFTNISFTNLAVVCSPTDQTYTVSFTITGGTQPYTVNGVGLSGSNYTSAPIASGTGYSFVLNDANSCGPVTVSGSQNCNCTTDAGTMNFTNAPLTQCYLTFQFSVPYNQNSVLDGNDTIQFVLHDNPGATLGNIFATSHTPVIQTPAGLTMGQTYYVSAVAGNDNGSGWVDLTDPCLSISQGVPIVFYVPTIDLGNDMIVCAEDCLQVPLTFTGFGPYSVEYSVFVNGGFVGVFNETNLMNGATIEFCPSDFGLTSGTLTIQVDGLIDDKGCIVFYPSNAPYPTLTLTIVQGVTTNFSPTLCSGESVTVNGTEYNAANPSGVEVFPGGSSFGCDSTVNVNLAFYPPAFLNVLADICPGESITVNGTSYNANNPTDTIILVNAAANGCDSVIYVNLTPLPSPTTNITQTLCTGGSITVNGMVYNESNPSGVETVVNGAANGCDSTIVVNLSFNTVVTSNINPTLCPGGSVTVNGTMYNAGNPSGTETMPGASYLGCDSVAMVNLAFYPPATGSFSQTICQNGSVTVGGTVFNQSNPSGTVTIPNGSVNGCDSTVMVSLAFYPPATGSFNPTICQNASVTVGGTIFNQNNPSGTVTIPNGSVNGCDSTVMVSLTFYPPATGNFSQTVCQNASVTVGGTVFNQNNPSGTVTIPNGSVNGCDSTVMVSLAFYPPATGSFNQTICQNASVTVGGTVFNQNNPSGTVTIPNSSVNGCDSTVMVSLAFYPAASSTIDDQLCTGGSITVNGTVYDAANPTGTEILQNASVNGCDSTVFINLSFGNSVVVTIDPTLCPDETMVINGTTYSAGNPTGTVTFPNGSYLGCDSTVNINLAFYPAAVGNITEILQMGGSIVVNGTVYNEQNPSGTEIFVGGSYTGCDSTVVINLGFEGEDALGIVTVTSPLCHFGDDGVITLTEIQGGVPPYVVALNGGSSSPVVSFPVVFGDLTFGFHTLTIIDALGTITSQEIFMADAPIFELDMDGPFSVPLGNNVVLGAGSASQIVTWSWSPPDYLSCTDCPAPVSTPLNDIVYTLAVTDANGCTAQGKLTVLVEKLEQVYVPNAFSPNNDGINDELTIFAGPQVDKIKSFQIFDRWGELVHELYNFEPNDLQLGWNGTFNGEDLDPGVFVWFAEIVFLDGQVRIFKGGVNLIK